MRVSTLSNWNIVGENLEHFLLEQKQFSFRLKDAEIILSMYYMELNAEWNAGNEKS